MFFDNIIFDIYSMFAAVAVCIAGIPQIYLLWKKKSSKNISLAMWFLLLFGLSAMWLREVFEVRNPIFIAQLSFSEFINISVIMLVVYFRYIKHSQEKETENNG